jgi:hypothetical protein
MQTIFKVVIIIIICFTSSLSAVADNNLEKQKEALKVIADFADRLCNKYSLIGRSETSELSGDAKVELKSILKQIASFLGH